MPITPAGLAEIVYIQAPHRTGYRKREQAPNSWNVCGVWPADGSGGEGFTGGIPRILRWA